MLVEMVLSHSITCVTGARVKVMIKAGVKASVTTTTLKADLTAAVKTDVALKAMVDANGVIIIAGLLTSMMLLFKAND